jgi:hypothetical protein
MVHRLKRQLGRIKGKPVEIARGVAIGILVGMTPFFGIHVVMSLALSWLFRGHYVAALIGIQITNVFTAPFVYALTYKVGSLFYGVDIVFHFSDLFSMATLRDVTVSLTIGGLMVGLPLALIAHRCVMMMLRPASIGVGG